MASTPASIRHCNPGAMYPGPSARKFGGKAVSIIGGGHKIVTFPDHISGAAALFDLLRRSYSGMTLAAAVNKWSGGNHVKDYLLSIEAATGFSSDVPLSDDFLANQTRAIQLAKAMAAHEAGQAYPLTHTQWKEAFAKSLESADAEPTPQLLELMTADLGLKEISGREHNQRIVDKWRVCGILTVQDDETAWCAVQVGSCLVAAGFKLPRDPQMARSYLRYGQTVPRSKVQPGDIVVTARGPAPFGHVGVVKSVNQLTGEYVAIAGNSKNQVRFEEPRKLKDALGFSRPVTGPRPVVDTIKQSKSLRSALNVLSLAAATITGAMHWLVQNIYGLLPDAVMETQARVDAVKQVSSWLSISPSTKVLMSVMLVGAAVFFIRELSEKRK